jgi:hypothetical protein
MRSAAGRRGRGRGRVAGWTQAPLRLKAGGPENGASPMGDGGHEPGWKCCGSRNHGAAAGRRKTRAPLLAAERRAGPKRGDWEDKPARAWVAITVPLQYDHDSATTKTCPKLAPAGHFCKCPIPGW